MICRSTLKTRFLVLISKWLFPPLPKQRTSALGVVLIWIPSLTFPHETTSYVLMCESKNGLVYKEQSLPIGNLNIFEKNNIPLKKSHLLCCFFTGSIFPNCSFALIWRLCNCANLHFITINFSLLSLWTKLASSSLTAPWLTRRLLFFPHPPPSHNLTTTPLIIKPSGQHRKVLGSKPQVCWPQRQCFGQTKVNVLQL